MRSIFKCFFLAMFFLTSSITESYANEKSYRCFDETTPEHVKDFYRLNHTHQTVAFVMQKKSEYLDCSKGKMGIWEAIAFLDSLVDGSDPDLDLPQSYHCYQTAEALRRDHQPRWLILTGFIHDLGKILALYGEPQWAIVGDTFPVGCAWSDKIVFPEYFIHNSDRFTQQYQTLYGIYTPKCGLDALHMSWGHDEYLYHVVKDYLPKEAAFIIRYHSFYALHQQEAYEYFLSEEDCHLLPWLKLFSQYDLYSKSSEKLNIDELNPYYEELVAEFFPPEIDW